MKKSDNNLYNKAFDFAKRIVKLGHFLIKYKKEFIIARQVIKSGTSIGANIAEANGAFLLRILQQDLQFL